MTRCRLCPRDCGARRDDHAGQGRCGMGALPRIARAALHLGEEPCISGARGSGTVFFCGCALGCVFCQNAAISRSGEMGQPVTADALATIFARLEAQGAHNINLVTGSHFVPAILEALRIHRPSIPVVLNSSGYERAETVQLLAGHVDIYLPDFKYADGRTAGFCADAEDYPAVALRAIRLMRAQTGPARYDADGMMLRGTLVRHLVLPGLSGASMRALSMLRDALPDDVPLSLMGQYTPMGRAKDIPGLDRPLLAREYRRVLAHMRALGFPGYAQAVEAAGTAMIPRWDGTGITPERAGPCDARGLRAMQEEP